MVRISEMLELEIPILLVIYGKILENTHLYWIFCGYFRKITHFYRFLLEKVHIYKTGRPRIPEIGGPPGLYLNKKRNQFPSLICLCALEGEADFYV